MDFREMIEDFEIEEQKPIPYQGDTEVEVCIDGDIDNYTPEDQRKFIVGISNVLSINGSIKITKMRGRSIYITILLLLNYAKDLVAYINEGKLYKLNIVSGNLLPPSIERKYSSQNTEKKYQP